ncbi:MAG TPA: tetratricopeptide repeat protein [Candidatus Limnocylindrales bacterium]
MALTTPRRSLAQEDRHVARAIGQRIRAARLRAAMTQREVAGDRYTKAYISALENGLIKPSVAALNFLAGRLGTTPAALLTDPDLAWRRLEADARLASGDWQAAADSYTTLLETEPDPRSRAELQLGLAEAYARLDRPRDSLAAASEAAALFDRLGQAALEAYSRYWIASAHQVAGNFDEASQLLNSILGAVRGGLDIAPDFEIRVLVGIAMLEAHLGQAERSLAHLTEAKARVDELDDRRRAAYFWALARGYREAGDMEAAIRAATESLGLYRAAESQGEVGSLSNELALVHLALGQLDRAREHAETARREFERTGDERWLAHVLETEAQIEFAAGDAEGALEKAGEAIRIAKRAKNRRALLSAHLTSARAARQLGRSADAHESFRAAADLARKDGDARRREVLSEWGDLYADEGDVARAYELAREALGKKA